jgi:hypothetical protein
MLFTLHNKDSLVLANCSGTLGWATAPLTITKEITTPVIVLIFRNNFSIFESIFNPGIGV